MDDSVVTNLGSGFLVCISTIRRSGTPHVGFVLDYSGRGLGLGGGMVLVRNLF